MGLFDKFKKNEDEGGEMVEERQYEEKDEEPEFQESVTDFNEPEPVKESPLIPDIPSEDVPSGGIGIRALMDKRAKLEDAIDYVGLMIKNLKDKRTGLEKDIEEEFVDIKNLKEKLVKVREYIDEENLGIENLTRKRGQVENEADEVNTMIGDLKGKLSGLDKIVDDEGKRIQSFKDSKPNP